MTLEEAEAYPELLQVVREKVKPERDKVNRESHRRYWWRFGEVRPGLERKASKFDKVLACALHTKHLSFSLLPSDLIYSHALAIVCLDDLAAFAILQSRSHEIWARFFGSSLEDRLRYTPTDCFETFPFPPDWQSNPTLETAGQTYYDYRAALMIRNDEGLTATYNRFHDPDESSPEILELRRLHAEMDRAVLEAYGWHDLAERATCEFALDYEEPEDEDDEGTGSKRKKKKPWRYKWPQELHDEVLARLLELNQQYAEAERLAGEQAQTNTTKPKKTKKTTSKKPPKKKAASKKPATEQVVLELREKIRTMEEAKPVVVELPYYNLHAAAGPFDEAQEVSSADTIRVRGSRKYQRRRGVSFFVARVVGRSMEPEIPDGSYGVYRRGASYTPGARVLVCRQRPEDPERGGRFVVKVYRPRDDGGPAQLVSLNPAYPTFDAGEDDRIVAEWVEAVEPES